MIIFLDAVAYDIATNGGIVEVAEVDALDERPVEAHAEAVAAKAGGIDIALNAVGIFHVQGTPLAELSLEDFVHPIASYTRTNFIAGTGYIGYGAACGAVESMSRLLAAELGPSGIRVICLLPHAIPEATAMGSHSRDVFRPFAERAGITVEQMLARHADTTLLKRLPTLAQVANVAAFVASDQAGAMTGTVVNLTCGTLVD